MQGRMCAYPVNVFMQEHTNALIKLESDVDWNRQWARQTEVGNECQMRVEKKIQGSLDGAWFLLGEWGMVALGEERDWVKGVCDGEGGVECGGLSLCLLHSSPLSLLLSPLSLFLAHYPLHRQTSPWATVKRTVLSHSYRQPQPEHCPALLILINTHTHASQSSFTSTPRWASLMDMLVGSRFFLWPPLAN